MRPRTGRGRELADEMEKRNIDVMCIQESKWGGNTAREIRGYRINEKERGLYYPKSGTIMYWK